MKMFAKLRGDKQNYVESDRKHFESTSSVHKISGSKIPYYLCDY